MEDTNMEDVNMEQSNMENPNTETSNEESSDKERSTKSRNANTHPKTGIKVIDDANIPLRLKLAQKNLTIAQQRYTSTESRLTSLRLTLPNFHFIVRKLDNNVLVLKEIVDLKQERLRTISHAMDLYKAWCAEVEKGGDPERYVLGRCIRRMRAACKELERSDEKSDEKYLELLKRLDPPFVEEDVVPVIFDESAGEKWRARGGKGL